MLECRGLTLNLAKNAITTKFKIGAKKKWLTCCEVTVSIAPVLNSNGIVTMETNVVFAAFISIQGSNPRSAVAERSTYRPSEIGIFIVWGVYQLGD